MESLLNEFFELYDLLLSVKLLKPGCSPACRSSVCISPASICAEDVLECSVCDDACESMSILSLSHFSKSLSMVGRENALNSCCGSKSKGKAGPSRFKSSVLAESMRPEGARNPANWCNAARVTQERETTSLLNPQSRRPVQLFVPLRRANNDAAMWFCVLPCAVADQSILAVCC